ncbi:MAG: type I-E CRISPR-associated protein Cas6/Cse3/CasE [Thiothrix sp.]|nr:type I-E CRISPR-associated protein Cas6/Cse3/CasE [Thiothrix sp.]HPE61775.1 type I-E CRISPR-associated protein Cas6/Cse3/CasE [Thiolinea sp.]
MFLSKIEINRARLSEAVHHLRRGEYHEHQIIWKLLPRDPEQQRDFLYRREDGGDLPFYYLLSAREPERVVDYLHISTQPYAPQLQRGDRLYFSLRANAVISRKADDGSQRRIRRDIVEARVDQYRTREPDSSRWPPKAAIHHEAGESWLKRQGEVRGFQVDSLFVQNHRYHQFYKSGNPQDTNQRQFTTLDFSGSLTVTDAGPFIARALFSGLGRARAYGCGLLLVRRV